MSPQRHCIETILFVYLLSFVILAASCSNMPDSGRNRRIAVSYTTTSDKSQLFAAKTIEIKHEKHPSGIVLTVDETKTYQEIDGFGAAMTWASCYNLLKMDPEDRRSFLTELFDKDDGMGISLIRVSIGASDFNFDEYTWCDNADIESFAMHSSDKEVVIPVLKEIYAINPDIKIIASPWSCPRWMKRAAIDDDRDYYSWTSGSLKPECYDDYATYFVRWIQTMESEGFNIYAMTIQNEPLNHGNSMSLYMTWEEQRDFIKTALGPAFERNGIKTKILAFDHNYNYDNVSSQRRYPLNIFQDADAAKFISGTAWHNYGGSVTELDNVLAGAPDKDIYFTEASIGSWNYSFDKCLIHDFNLIFLQTMERGCKGVTLWNMVLDEGNGPFSPQKGSCKTCYGVATLQAGSGKIIDRTSHYYDIAHASKVVKPGAVRVGVSGDMPDGIVCQAFVNPGGSLAVLILNDGTEDQTITLTRNRRTLCSQSPAKSIVSIIW